MSGTSTPSRRLSSTTMRVAPPSRRKARSCNSAQIRELERKVSRRIDLRLQPSVITNSRVRRYLRLSGSRTMGPAPYGAGPVIDLRLLAGCGDDHHAGFGHLGSAPFAHEPLHALVAAGEAVLADQVLPDGPRIPASTEPQLDGFPVGLASAGARTVICTRGMLPRFAACLRP